MTNTAGESSARGSEDAPAAPEEDAPARPDDDVGSADRAPAPDPAPARSTGVRWGDDTRLDDTRLDDTRVDEDATPSTGVAAPGPGDVVPARTSGTAPEATPGAAWAHPGYRPGPWQQTTPGWAPPAASSSLSSPAAPATPPDPARRRRVRRVVLGVVLGVVVLALVVVALLAFLIGPRFARYDVLDRAAVERGVSEVVTRDWKRQVTDVSCPDGERVRPGSTFSCTATVDGRPARVPVDVVDEAGTYEVGQPR